MKLNLREAQARDAPAIANLVSANFQGEVAQYTVVGQAGYGRYMQDLIDAGEGDNQMILVGELDGNLIGFADVRQQSKSAAFLSRFCIDQRVQGRGLGKQFMREMFGSISAEKWMLDVFADNLAAVCLYERLGFRSMDELQWYVAPLPDLRKQCSNLDLQDTRATYDRYGFGNLNIESGSGLQYSLVGSAIRVSGVPAEEDLLVLAGIRASFPNVSELVWVERAAVISGSSEIRPSQSRRIATSSRMSRKTGSG